MLVHDVESKLRCLEREMKMRAKVYPRWVAEQRMSQEQADYEVLTLTSIIADYRAVIEEREPRFEM